MRYVWNDKKNKLLRKIRLVSFEQIVQSIADGHLLDVIDNPNQAEYAEQVFMVVELENYVYIVPALIDEETGICELKTIYPSRKYTARYLGESNE